MEIYLIRSEGAFADPAADRVMAQDFLLDDGERIKEGLMFLAEVGIGLGGGLILLLSERLHHLQLLNSLHHFLQLLTIEINLLFTELIRSVER